MPLIKSVLSSILFFYLSLFSIPCLVMACIDAACRRFLWNAFDGSSKFPLVQWNQIYSPSFKGGLGFPSLKMMNDALLVQWLWKFGYKKGALWRRVVAAKYGTDSMDWNCLPVNSPYGVSVWRGFMKRNE